MLRRHIKTKSKNHLVLLSDKTKARGELRFLLLNVNLTDQVSDQVNERVELPISDLGDKILSATEPINKLGLFHRPSFRKNYLIPAIRSG